MSQTISNSSAATSTSVDQMISAICQNALEASRVLTAVSTEDKNCFLADLAVRLVNSAAAIEAANRKDLEAGEANGLSAPMLERLRMTPKRIEQMAEGVRQVAALPDPVGAVLDQKSLPNGLSMRKVRVPIGVIGIIYESRPNVTIDCAVLCLKSGNATILRGGKEAYHTNSVLGQLIQESLRETGLPENAVQVIPTTDRSALVSLLKQDSSVHCIIPRGGESLIRFVTENSRIPVIKHYLGVCSVYVDAEADAEMAREVVINAKCQRPSVCNAIENLVLHRDVLQRSWPEIARSLQQQGVELRCDAESGAVLSASGIPWKPATEEDYKTEYLDLILSVKTVADTRQAIDFINRYDSAHSEAIVTSNPETAATFLNEVDSATVYWNASTRFTDGFEFGMGAEIGISTDRLHARGPMGLEELCTYKYLLSGNGAVRK
jgi:glutamate-5-semialdehyde dehydrogenase